MELQIAHFCNLKSDFYCRIYPVIWMESGYKSTNFLLFSPFLYKIFVMLRAGAVVYFVVQYALWIVHHAQSKILFVWL